MEALLVHYSFLVASGIAFVILAWSAWSVLNWILIRPKRLEKQLRKQGFSGNSYKFWYGDTKEISKMIREAISKPINITDDVVPRVDPFHHNSVMTHGKKAFYWLGRQPALIITDPEQVKTILTHSFQFKKLRLNPLGRLLVTGLVDYEDEQWVKHRKLINPAFNMEKLKNMLPAFHLSSSAMVAKWENLLANQGSCEINIWGDLQTMTCDIISRTAFGSNYEEGTRIFELLRELARLVIITLQSVYIPGWRFVPTESNKKIKQIDSEINSSLDGIINKRMKQIKAGEGNNDDLLGILLESNIRETELHGKSRTNVWLSIKEVIDECRVIYLAGEETTSSLLVWIMIMLSKYQDWQEKARQEVLEVFGTKAPTSDGLSHLKIVTMIIHEVLRLYPPAATLNRTVSEETKLGEVVIPSGAVLSVPISLIHTDHEIWGDDAKEFKPERFSEGISNATKNQQGAFFGFGWGPRNCIGQNFVTLQTKMAMAMILQRFSFELSPSYTHAPYINATLQPQHGAHLILHKCG